MALFNSQTRRHMINTLCNFGYWVIVHAILSSADFFQNQLFRKIISGIPPECQTVWTQTRPDVLLGVIWTLTVYKISQQTRAKVSLNL